MQDRPWNRVVTHNSIVYEHGSNDKHIDCDAEGCQFDHSHFDHIESTLDWLDGGSEGFGVDGAEVEDCQAGGEEEDCEEDEDWEVDRLGRGVEVEL